MPFSISQARFFFGTVLLSVLAACASQNALAEHPEIVLENNGVAIALTYDTYGYELPHAQVQALIARGVQSADIGQVVPAAAERKRPELEIRFHTERGFRPVRSVITATLLRGRTILRTVSTVAPAPGAAPLAVFTRTVADLTRRILSQPLAFLEAE